MEERELNRILDKLKEFNKEFEQVWSISIIGNCLCNEV